MPKLRKKAEDYDPDTARGREALSLMRNRGADRVINYVKRYQEASEHKVKRKETENNSTFLLSVFPHAVDWVYPI